MAEQRAAADILGVRDIVHLGYPDGYLEPTLDLRRDVTRQIRRFRPDLVITQNPQRRLDHNPFVGHPDHLATGEATLAVGLSGRARPPELPRALAGREPRAVEGAAGPPHRRRGAEPVGRRGGDVRDRDGVDLAHVSQVDPDEVEERMRERARLVGEPQGIGLAQAFLSILLE